MIFVSFLFCILTRIVWGMSDDVVSGFIFAGSIMWFYYEFFKLVKRCSQYEPKQS